MHPNFLEEVAATVRMKVCRRWWLVPDAVAIHPNSHHHDVLNIIPNLGYIWVHQRNEQSRDTRGTDNNLLCTTNGNECRVFTTKQQPKKNTLSPKIMTLNMDPKWPTSQYKRITELVPATYLNPGTTYKGFMKNNRDTTAMDLCLTSFIQISKQTV